MESHNYTQELHDMDSRLNGMENKIDDIDQKLTQVVDALLGNPLTKQGGFVQEIIEINIKIIELNKKAADLELKQQSYEEFKKRILWTIGILIAIGVFIERGLNMVANIVRQ